jgi:hypothetical protein
MKLSDVELFAILGEDEFGSGEIGLKQALAPAGVVAMVATRRDKVEQFWAQYEAQARRFGKRISLVRFVGIEILRVTENGE